MASTQAELQGIERQYKIPLDIQIMSCTRNQYGQISPLVHQYQIRNPPTLVIGQHRYEGRQIRQALDSLARSLAAGMQNTVQMTSGSVQYHRPQMPVQAAAGPPIPQQQGLQYTNNAVFNPNRQNTYQNNLHTTETAQGAGIHDDGGVSSSFTNSAAFTMNQLSNMYDGNFTMQDEYDQGPANDREATLKIVTQRAEAARQARQGYVEQMRMQHPLAQRFQGGQRPVAIQGPQRQNMAPAMGMADMERMRQAYAQRSM